MRRPRPRARSPGRRASRKSARHDGLAAGSTASPASAVRAGCSYVSVDIWSRARLSETLRSMDERPAEQETDAAAIRLVLVDDHTMLRHGLRQSLRDHGFDVVGEASNGRSGAQLVLELKPDVVVMDLDMPQMNGIEATRAIVAAEPGARVLMLTISTDDDDVLDALAAGACGYLLKTAPPEETVRAIEAAHAGDSTISPRVASRLVERVRETAGRRRAAAFAAHPARARDPPADRRRPREQRDRGDPRDQPEHGEEPRGARARQARDAEPGAGGGIRRAERARLIDARQRRPPRRRTRATRRATQSALRGPGRSPGGTRNEASSSKRARVSTAFGDVRVRRARRRGPDACGHGVADEGLGRAAGVEGEPVPHLPARHRHGRAAPQRLAHARTVDERAGAHVPPVRRRRVASPIVP